LVLKARPKETAGLLLLVRRSPVDDGGALRRYPSAMRFQLNFIFLFALSMIARGAVLAQQAPTTSVPVTASVPPPSLNSSLVLLAGPDHPPVALSPTDFAAIPHVTLTVHNAHSNADETYSGVPLATLLAKLNAPLGSDLRGKEMTRYIIATGADHYSVVFSLAEIDPSFHAGQVIVADMRDGKPLGGDGPFRLVITDDKRPARWVHNLVTITLANAQ
jgi:hypothetical protein